MLFSEAVEKFLENLDICNKSQETILGYKKELRYFITFWEDKYNYPPELDDVTDSNIEEYLKYKKDKKLATSSISRALNILRSFYKFLCKKKLYDINVAYYVDSVKVIKKPRQFLTEEEFKKVLEHTDNKLMSCIFDVIFHSGLRISELTNLKIEDVDLNDKVMHIWGKGKKYRNVPISDRIYSVLSECLNIKGNYFFATKKTGKVSQQYVNRCLKNAVKKAGIKKKISCHSLRHSFATNLLAKGANIQDVRELLGHSNIKVTSIYLHSISQNLRKSINLL